MPGSIHTMGPVVPAATKCDPRCCDDELPCFCACHMAPADRPRSWRPLAQLPPQGQLALAIEETV